MELVLNFHETHTHIEYPYGTPMRLSRCFHETPVGRSLSQMLPSPVGLPGDFNGTSKILPELHETTTRLPWCLHGTPTVFPWDFHGTPIMLQ